MRCSGHWNRRSGSQRASPIRHGRLETAPEARAGSQSKRARSRQLSVPGRGVFGETQQRVPPWSGGTLALRDSP